MWNVYCRSPNLRSYFPEVLKLCQEEMKDTVAIESLDQVDYVKYRSLVNKIQPPVLSQYVIADHRLRGVRYLNPLCQKVRTVNDEILFIVLDLEKYF